MKKFATHRHMPAGGGRLQRLAVEGSRHLGDGFVRSAAVQPGDADAGHQRHEGGHQQQPPEHPPQPFPHTVGQGRRRGRLDRFHRVGHIGELFDGKLHRAGQLRRAAQLFGRLLGLLLRFRLLLRFGRPGRFLRLGFRRVGFLLGCVFRLPGGFFRPGRRVLRFLRLLRGLRRRRLRRFGRLRRVRHVGGCLRPFRRRRSLLTGRRFRPPGRFCRPGRRLFRFFPVLPGIPAAGLAFRPPGGPGAPACRRWLLRRGGGLRVPGLFRAGCHGRPLPGAGFRLAAATAAAVLAGAAGRPAALLPLLRRQGRRLRLFRLRDDPLLILLLLHTHLHPLGVILYVNGLAE